MATAILTLGVVSGSLATGMPRILMPAGVVAVAALAQFHLHRSIADYILFSMGAAVALFWFLVRIFLTLRGFPPVFPWFCPVVAPFAGAFLGDVLERCCAVFVGSGVLRSQRKYPQPPCHVPPLLHLLLLPDGYPHPRIRVSVRAFRATTTSAWRSPSAAPPSAPPAAGSSRAPSSPLSRRACGCPARGRGCLARRWRRTPPCWRTRRG